MIRLIVDRLGMQWGNQQLFSSLCFELRSGDRLAILGANGSGKSTLVRILSGQLSPTTGKVLYYYKNEQINREKWYQYIAWMSPAIELYPDLSLLESYQIHFSVKQPVRPIKEILDLIWLSTHIHQPLKSLSSGMLQRARLGMAIFADTQILLLDEPTTNLDEQGSYHMLELIEKYRNNRIYLLASNRKEEYIHFDNHLHLNQ